MIICMFSGCSKGISGPMTSGEADETKASTSSVKETLEIVQQTSESIPNEGELGKTESLFDVTITLPYMYFDKDLDPVEYTKEKGFKNTTIHDNGNVSLTMSKSRYDELMSNKHASNEDFFNNTLVNGTQNPYVKAITATEGFRKIAVDVNRAGYKGDAGMTSLQIWIIAMNYQHYAGVELYCEIVVYDVLTGEVIETVVYPKGANVPSGETASTPISTIDPKFDFMTDDKLKAVQYADINSDGIEDYVQIYCPYDPQGYYDKYILRIGDTKAFFEGDGIEPEYFSLVDVDKSDKLIEIVVSEISSSDVSKTSFFRYDGRSIIKLGSMDGFYGKYRLGSYSSLGDVIVDGSGVIKTQTRGDILHTWHYDDEYIIESNTLRQVPKDLYFMNHKVTVIKEITLKKSRTGDSPGITLKVGETVTIMETDNKSWCSVMNSKGETGWFEVYDYGKIKGTESFADEFFDGLFHGS
jgi:hypothetical protein